MLLVYIPKSTPRLRYIFNFLLKEVMGLDYRLTENSAEFIAEEGPKLNYSTHALGGELFIQARNLLFETGISDQNINVSDWRNNKIFYSTGKNSALPFDPFAASFYLVSRYEEYLPHIRDHYDRFEAKTSIAGKNGFLRHAVVNTWAGWLKEIILLKFPFLNPKSGNYSFISTIDIDNAYAYREKGMLRSLGGFIRSFSRLNMIEVNERMRVLMGKTPDPYDTYEYQLGVQKKYGLHVIYFFLLGDYALNDKNINPENQHFRQLIKMLADYADAGIHPSFSSNTREGKLRIEIDRLSSIIHRDITKSRQHFLKLRLPDTYRALIETDIQEDYSMGFASKVGFRAGTCTPFLFYDIDLETETTLRVFPFAVMEGTLKDYMKVPPEEAMQHIRPLIDEVKSANGTFISLWHNETLNNRGQWKGWRKVYEEMIEYAIP